MTEAEWLACADPQEMLGFLKVQGNVSVRKLRLVVCACCRRAWQSLKNSDSRRAVEVAERFADGLATPQELGEAGRKAHELAGLIRSAHFQLSQEQYLGSDEAAEEGGGEEARPDRPGVAWREGAAVQAASWAAWSKMTEAQAQHGLRAAQQAAPGPVREGAHQARIIQEVSGNPFRPLAVDAGWQTPTIIALAQAAYDDRTLPAGTLDNARLSVLADALEEAGCNNAGILNHLRQPGEHVRGCWVVDLLLRKE
jgi:hypothetical protein